MDFKILGPLEIHDGGRRLTPRGPKQRLLLAVLLLREGEVVSSDQLVESLWGANPPPTATKTIQMHVSQLRALLEPERARGAAGRRIVTRPPGYELRIEQSQLDLNRFQRTVAEARRARDAGRQREAASLLRDALALWRGPPLADLGFESALQGDIARLVEARLTALEDRFDADLALGRHADVIGELEGCADEHPLRERVRAQLMLALYRTGRQSEALEVYRETRRALVEELGIEPSRELRELERAILAQDPGLDPPAAVATVPADGRPAAARLVGRERELADVRTPLESALAGAGGVILVGGEPGIGKSRFAEALAALAHDRGARVLVGRCWEAGGAPPYWPWVQALRSLVRETDAETLRAQAGRGAAELATILPELEELVSGIPDAPVMDSEGARFQLFDAVAGLLARAASDRPLAVFLDDLHAADASSLLLLQFVAAQIGTSPTLIVGCYRDTEGGPELHAALAELSREPAVHRLALKGLNDTDTARLLETTMARVPEAELAERVQAQTAGNPLFVAEVGRLLASPGAAAVQLPPDGGLPIPDGVREAIDRRLQRQSDACRELLTTASAIGREFDLRLLGRVTGLEEDGLFEGLEEAAAARLVNDVPGVTERLRFSHVLIRDVLYDGLPATRRLRVHREIGEALEALHDRNLEPHVAELAHHFARAGSGATDRASHYAERAGHRAAAQLGYEEAARQYAAALELAEREGSADDGRTCDLLLSLGEALSRSGDDLAARDAYLRAAEVAQEAGWPDRLARAAVGYGGRFVWARAGSGPELVPLLERALAALGEDDSRQRVRVLARLACALRDEPASDRRVALAREAVESARRLADPVTLGHAIEGQLTGMGPDSDPSRLSVAQELISLGEQIGDRERMYIGRDVRLNTAWMLADRAGVDVELEALGKLADDLRQPAQQWAYTTGRTMLALMEGRFAQAEELIEQALAVGEKAQTWNAVVSYRLARFVLCREQGRLAEVEDAVERSVHEFPALRRFRCAQAHLYGELGRAGDARTVLAELLALDLAHEYFDEEWLFTLCLLPDVCALVEDGTAAARLHDLLAPHESLYAQAPVEASFGSVARALGVLAATAGRLDQAERHLEMAIDVERRMGARPWLAHAQHDLAAVLVARDAPGDDEHARVLRDEALVGYHELGMTTWATRVERLAADVA